MSPYTVLHRKDLKRYFIARKASERGVADSVSFWNESRGAISSIRHQLDISINDSAAKAAEKTMLGVFARHHDKLKLQKHMWFIKWSWQKSQKLASEKDPCPSYEAGGFWIFILDNFFYGLVLKFWIAIFGNNQRRASSAIYTSWTLWTSFTHHLEILNCNFWQKPKMWIQTVYSLLCYGHFLMVSL